MPRRCWVGRVCVAAVLAWGVAAGAGDAGVGEFQAKADVGDVQPPGRATFDNATKQYRVRSAGANIWGKADAFHFVYRPIRGDLRISAEVELLGDGKNAHRKGGCMIRQGTEPDDAYVDVMVHGDGLVALQYRPAKGEETKDVKSEVKSPAVVRIERKGSVFTAYAAPKEAGKEAAFVVVGTVTVKLTDPVCAGLAVTSHDAKESETAVFSKVAVEEGKP